MSQSLFTESVINHQLLVDKMLEFKNEEGICEISQPELARLTNHSQTWVTSAIKRLNTEDTCIEIVGPSKYVVHYPNIGRQGVFSKIFQMMFDLEQDPCMFRMKEAEIASIYSVKLKTIKMFKSYILTGWRVSSKEPDQNRISFS